MKRLAFAAIAAILITAAINPVSAVTTSFSLTDISSGNGLWASATATVTTGSGYIDILLVNTSPRQNNFMGTGNSANPFISEIEINLHGYNLDGTNSTTTSYVESTATTRFAQGAGNAAIILSPAARTLYYKMTESDSPGMNKCLMFGDADNQRNDSAIGSINVLDPGYVPQEDFAVGWLDPNPTPPGDHGMVFDSALFHFMLDTTDTPDASLWANSGLVVKFQGGGGYSQHVANVPEPATVALLGLGALALLRKRK